MILIRESDPRLWSETLIHDSHGFNFWFWIENPIHVSNNIHNFDLRLMILICDSSETLIHESHYSDWWFHFETLIHVSNDSDSYLWFVTARFLRYFLQLHVMTGDTGTHDWEAKILLGRRKKKKKSRYKILRWTQKFRHVSIMMQADGHKDESEQMSSWWKKLKSACNTPTFNQWLRNFTRHLVLEEIWYFNYLGHYAVYCLLNKKNNVLLKQLKRFFVCNI